MTIPMSFVGCAFVLDMVQNCQMVPSIGYVAIDLRIGRNPIKSKPSKPWQI